MVLCWVCRLRMCFYRFVLFCGLSLVEGLLRKSSGGVCMSLSVMLS